MFKLRDYQQTLSEQGTTILQQLGCVYLCMQPRTGKTATAFTIANNYGAKNVLVLTKLKAIPSIQGDYDQMGLNFKLTCCNYESLHKLEWNFDLVICDESHVLSAFAKPAQRTKLLRERCYNLPAIFLSATPSAESYSQMFHQFWITKCSPFDNYKNFYAWSKDYVNVKQKRINGFTINDYSGAIESKVKEAIKPYMLSFSQEQAGFTSFVEEEILYVDIMDSTYDIMKRIKKDKIYNFPTGEEIIADTPVRMQSIFHQLSSGTLKLDDDKRIVVDQSKAYYIRAKFTGKKIAIFYNFIAEGELLREIFPNSTSVPEEFNANDDSTFICQISSAKEGTNLSSADCLVFYNISFSSTSYWQSRERMSNKDRVKDNKMYWVFSQRGIEGKVYNAVVNKKNYTQSYFVKDLKTLFG